jgi:hypothetical protein
MASTNARKKKDYKKRSNYGIIIAVEHACSNRKREKLAPHHHHQNKLPLRRLETRFAVRTVRKSNGSSPFPLHRYTRLCRYIYIICTAIHMRLSPYTVTSSRSHDVRRGHGMPRQQRRRKKKGTEQLQKKALFFATLLIHAVKVLFLLVVLAPIKKKKELAHRRSSDGHSRDEIISSKQRRKKRKSKKNSLDALYY